MKGEFQPSGSEDTREGSGKGGQAFALIGDPRRWSAAAVWPTVWNALQVRMLQAHGHYWQTEGGHGVKSEMATVAFD